MLDRLRGGGAERKGCDCPASPHRFAEGPVAGESRLSPSSSDEINDLLAGQAQIQARDIKGRTAARLRAKDEDLAVLATDSNRTLAKGAVKQCREPLPGL